ncbi:hypothetical protein ACI7RC_18240 [Brevibacillus sp. B_LB10_24]|uniref:hypothetical protein n=1 Tax=Brevibacillus sp. B_LB10_24 TaxID=3380645 RepID=UPI0038B9BA18
MPEATLGPCHNQSTTVLGSDFDNVSLDKALSNWMTTVLKLLSDTSRVPIAGCTLFSTYILLFLRIFVRAYTVRATFIAHGVPSTDKKENLQRASLLYLFPSSKGYTTFGLFLPMKKTPSPYWKRRLKLLVGDRFEFLFCDVTEQVGFRFHSQDQLIDRYSFHFECKAPEWHGYSPFQC